MPKNGTQDFRFSISSEEDTFCLSQDIALALQPGDVLALYGELGVGKTAFCRGLIRTLLGNPQQEVPSPTFSILQIYAAHVPIRHLDLYRIGDAEELEELGFFSELDTSITLIEWPIRAESLLPEDSIKLELNIAHQGQRILRLSVPEEKQGYFKRSFNARTFLKQHGITSRWPMAGDASNRSYEWVRSDKPQDEPATIFMNAPKTSSGNIIKDGKTYDELVHRAQDVYPFIVVANLLVSEGFSAPQIYQADIENGFLLLEDLGTDTLLDKDSQPIKERYLCAIDTLAQLHNLSPKHSRKIHTHTGVYEIPAFDKAVFLTELQLLPDWYAAHLDIKLKKTALEEYSKIWLELYDELKTAEQGLLLRDVHAPNLLWLENRHGIRRVGLLDFQDALWGAQAYDIASLIYDARVTVPKELRQNLLDHYIAKRQNLHLSEMELGGHITILTAQRLSKILGVFSRLANYDGRTSYLAHMPRNQNYLAELLQAPILHEVNAWHKHYLPIASTQTTS